eukprot:CAMPEP_0119508816 /NCGR_PEP_ID=MMETSP1344-20130328/28305_1 /TAXON_ID=236787 /ORGANISM="Florenciella parvula, Strain CCMP2471" /LENGTH=115 /DNA_ID=CAMNT_0007545581 /DNA_START=66 /DNA_END=410 /DNA_ORIENTATION=+
MGLSPFSLPFGGTQAQPLALERRAVELGDGGLDMVHLSERREPETLEGYNFDSHRPDCAQELHQRLLLRRQLGARRVPHQPTHEELHRGDAGNVIRRHGRPAAPPSAAACAAVTA